MEDRPVKTGTSKHELELVCKDGSYVWTEGYVTPIRDENGQLVGYVGITRDISERKRAEALLRDRTEAPERSNGDLEEFAYVAAHDLREPLIAVGAYLKVLERRCAKNLDADAHKFISRAIKTTLRMDAIIQSLSAYSRIASDDRSLEPTDCQAVLKNALSNLHSAIKESGATVTSDAVPTLMADTSQMLQLFQNLLSNAIRYRGDEPLKIHVSCAQGIGEFQFSVKDNGIGIEPPYFEPIFRIFQRVENGSHRPGTGIGLANCKKIVERHGGRIWVESEPGVGSTFFFTLPDRLVLSRIESLLKLDIEVGGSNQTPIHRSQNLNLLNWIEAFRSAETEAHRNQNFRPSSPDSPYGFADMIFSPVNFVGRLFGLPRF